MTRPNVVLVVLDTARRDRVSAYGYDRETTPNFDRFAADATLYTDPVAQAPWSIPSHASLFTGAYPTGHGASTVRPVFGADAPLAERLRRVGYATAAVSANPYVRPANGFAHGFEEFHGPGRPGGATVPASVADRLARTVRPIAHRVTAAGLRRPLERLFGLLRCRDAPTVGADTDGAAADWLPARVAAVAARLPEPYFLFVNITTAHLPRSPAPAALDRFVAPELRETPVVPNERAHALGDGLSERERQALTQLYDADLRTADRQLGEVLASVDLPDALVAVVSDHGEHLGEFGLVGHQYSVFEPVVSVPLAVSFPASVPTSTPNHVDAQVEIRRLYHTILDAAGVDPAPALSLASGAGDEHARGSFASPMVDVWQFLQSGTFSYDKAHLGRRLRFVRDGDTKRVQYGDRSWLFGLPEQAGAPVSVDARLRSGSESESLSTPNTLSGDR